MGDWPSSRIPAGPTITPWSLESIGHPLATLGSGLTGATSGAYPTTNMALYVPFVATEPLVTTKLWIANAGTVSGNVDAGIYSEDGTRIVSKGSTAQAGTNAIQVLDITDTLLGPGLFYLAVALDNGVGTLLRLATTAEILRALGVFQQATAFPLPATFTLATMAQAYMPLFGLTTRTVM